MSYKEKSILTSLILTVIIFGFYFIKVFGTISPTDSGLVNGIVLFVGAVLYIVLLEMILRIILPIFHKNEPKDSDDERDKIIQLKATRISYLILVLGMFFAIIFLLLSLTQLLIANIILLFFIVAEITGFSIQLFYYRKGF
ncbi:hypothetical protein ACFLZD_01210 [Candidatus Neomarinimicrobiota bacterium]